MERVISGEVNIGVYAKVKGVWTYVGHYYPLFDGVARPWHGIAHLRKLAIQYMQRWFAMVGVTEMKTVLD